MVCASCDASIHDGAPFCETCGTPVEGRVVQPPTTPIPCVAPDDAIAVTPPAVAEPWTVPASVRVRIASAAIDAAIPLSAAGLVVVASIVTGITGLAVLVAPLVAICLGVWNVAFASLTGASYGRAAMGARVVVAGPGGPVPGFSRIWVRSLLAGLTCHATAFTVPLHPRRRGWHDRVAGVEVIDILDGPNPFGERTVSPVLRRSRRGLVDISSPIERPAGVVDVPVAP